MRNITIYNPEKLVFGPGSIDSIIEDCFASGFNRIFIITIPSIVDRIKEIIENLESKGISVKIYLFDRGEPTFGHYADIRNKALSFGTDSIIGIGGGSVMDIAKIVAALLKSQTDVSSVVGNGLISEKGVPVICIPTTSGTGSEVSPNSILMDANDFSKKGIISPYLVPDATYIDPELTIDMPPNVTANTGIDALTHCIEAYANKNAHPLVDKFALEGIKLIFSNLKKAFDKGDDIEARTNMSMGSMYGGMCLGPVNTAAVHALAYPLGSRFKISHGLSNAILLPYVIEYNLDAGIQRYAEIAVAAGAEIGKNDRETALNGIGLLKKLMAHCKIPDRLSMLGIPENDIEKMAEEAMQVQRLLKNNIKEIKKEDAIAIYKMAF